ncbi:MAG: Methyltransferase protein [uncultured bacterium]|nr:MAG: Methyltransferase protein [uncultured bacterium]
MDIDYTKYHRDKEYLDNERLFKNIFKRRLKIINRFIKSPKTVLDIGCSNGVFLDLFEKSETWGVEPSHSGCKIKDGRHKITHKYFEKANLPQNYFDLIIMNHTLEHVVDAEIVLVKVYRLLKKGGILFIDVPNAGGLGSMLLGKKWPYRLENEHTYQFTKDSLSNTIEDGGYRILHWESRSGLFELSNPLLDLYQSLIGFKKRFIFNILASPYHLVSSILQMGDSMSFVVRKD